MFSPKPTLLLQTNLDKELNYKKYTLWILLLVTPLKPSLKVPEPLEYVRTISETPAGTCRSTSIKF